MITILLVEDNSADARLVQIALANAKGARFDVSHVERLSQALHKLGGPVFDAILLDLSLPDSHGLDTVNQVRAAAPETPIVVLSGLADEEQALAAVKCGAQDYLVKGQGDDYLLPRAIRYAIERHRIERELQRAKDELERRVEERTAELAKTNDELRSEIAERQRAVQELTESKERLARTEAFSLVMLTHVGLDGRWLKVPPTLCDLLGYSEEKLLAGYFKNITHPDDFDADWSQCQRLILGEIKSFDLEKRYIHKDGEIIWVYLNCSIVVDKDGAPLHFLTYIRNIAKRKQAEQALRESEQQLRLITNNLPVLIAYVDSEQLYRFNNKAYEDWFGLPQAELRGQHIRDVMGNAAYQELLPGIKRVLAGESVNFEKVLPGKNGSSRYINATYIPDFDAQGEVKGFFALIKDVSSRKQAEVQEKQRMLELAHVSRLSNMGEMATEIAHELNQPLTAIKNYGNACLRLLDSPQWTPEDMVKGFQAMVKQAARSGEIIRNLREFVRKADAGRSRSSINELVSVVGNLVQVEARPRQVEIRLEPTDGLPAIMVNKVLIEQVILNLMRNAIEAMEECAEGNQQRLLIIQTSLASDDSIEVLVKDTGPGLSEQAMQEVFEPFFTTKAQGMGVGLSICRSIIDEHGGRIWVEANYPQGAVFRFMLPTAEGKCVDNE